MPRPLRFLVSLVFVIQNALAMLVLGIVFAPFALFTKRGALLACKTYCVWVLWTARWMIGLRYEIRGPVPAGEVMIAAKHQSFLDIMLIFYHVPWAKFIMKRELLWTPIIGIYAKRLGCIPVNRGRKGAAIAKMVKDVAKEFEEPGQLIIYPQGTRVPAGEYRPYKVGTAVLYEGLNQPCVPAATNVGLFWPKGTIMRYPGTAIVEFMQPIAPGVARDVFLADLETQIEEKSNALMREGGFDGVH